MRIVVTGGRLVDPAAGLDGNHDLLLEDGRVVEVADGGSLARTRAGRIIDAAGKWVLPGFIDLHVHFRTPGEEYKEDIASGSRAAAAGGFAAVCCMANTHPVNDNASVTEHIVSLAARHSGGVRIYPVGACTLGLKGEQLAPMAEMAEAGCVAFSDDGKPIMSGRMMRRVLEYASSLGKVVSIHAQDLELSDSGHMHEGVWSTRLGLRGLPAAAEDVMIARDIALCEYTGARLHVAHISTAGSVALLRDAKERGLPVTAEVTPHHLALTDGACASYDTATKMYPPLRGEADREACIDALADGTIDAVATDHAPHSSLEKDVEFQDAAFGTTGLETAASVVLGLVQQGRLELGRAVDSLTAAAARCFGLPGGTLKAGAPADLVVLDPEARWRVEGDGFHSKSPYSAFNGQMLQARASVTVASGKVVHG